MTTDDSKEILNHIKRSPAISAIDNMFLDRARKALVESGFGALEFLEMPLWTLAHGAREAPEPWHKCQGLISGVLSGGRRKRPSTGNSKTTANR